MRVSDKTRRFLEVSANIAILVVAIIIVRNLIWSKWQTKTQPQGPAIGTELSLPGIRWADDTTLVMVLQKGCRYCEESSAFYRKLRDQRVGTRPRMLAVVPGDRAEVADYLSKQGVIVDEIVNVPLSDINVPFTPTLLLVDHAGKVRATWVGKLDASRETEVIQRIRPPL